MADANIPPMCWDIVVQHIALLNAYRLLLFVIRRLQFSKLTQVSFLISLRFHRQHDNSIALDFLSIERQSSVQILKWIRKMNLEYF